ncbi:hypothetical protein VKT23_014497 [Stygiomarasmius scandens]|uniref:HET-domain-containing protein n=1 Tax=Marasmiellus scandens TaxID=2682957 RepID=A0ABR1J026_9AGAR
MPRRLLDAHSLLVVDFDDTDKVPLYAIISHISGFPNNWQEFLHQEVFDDQTEIEEQSEYSKLRKACSVSTQLGIRYLWIDTCNDQRENDGFTQLRYAYYQNSEVCLVYLDDISEEMSDYWYRSRWFKRGWTLLELVAPREQFFFNGHWRLLESRRLLAEGISATIGLGQNILADAPPISNVTVEERLRWVQLVSRTSLKPHDTVYCLMGVLEVEMEVNYDEPAEKTFSTFQEKFIQTHPHVPIPLVLEFLSWRCFLAAGYPVPPISWPSRESNVSISL